MKLHIKNFKCFTDSTIELNNFTVLVGMNGVGKSSVIQALLLLRETIERLEKQEVEIPLNGPYGLSLGTSTSVINQKADSSDFYISLEDEKEKISEVKFSIDSDTEQLWAKCSNMTFKGGSILEKKEFYYLNAERIGPRISQNLQNLSFLNVGFQGEYTAQVIDSNGGREKIEGDRMLERTKDPNLSSQINFWMNKILPGVNVYAHTDMQNLQAQIKIENKFSVSTPVLAPNIGFGISYVLPIIVTGLIAKKQSFFIVENPEAHLHPAAQSAIGEFLGMVSRCGVNVIVETHSDHVINGLQIDVAKHPEFHDRVTINNFSISENNIDPQIEPITISEKGELMNWPKGFLDQAQIDYITLKGISRNV